MTLRYIQKRPTHDTDAYVLVKSGNVDVAWYGGEHDYVLNETEWTIVVYIAVKNEASLWGEVIRIEDFVGTEAKVKKFIEKEFRKFLRSAKLKEA